MELLANQDVPAWESTQSAGGRTPPGGPDPKIAWGLFLFIGLPLGLMAALELLAAARVYVEPLRQFWLPWPPDIVKSFFGAAVFAATLAFLSHRVGWSAGYRSGTVAATAEARNLEEGRRSASGQAAPPELSRASPDPPLPSPEAPPIPLPAPEEPALSGAGAGGRRERERSTRKARS